MKTKTCITCLGIKNLEEFSFKNKNKNERSCKCKQCSREYAKTHYNNNKGMYKEKSKKNKPLEMERIRKLLDELKGDGGCEHCGIKNHIVLEFHHTDPSMKEGDVSKLAYLNKSKARKEAKKCIILCSNCHKIEHWRLKNI